MIIGLDLDGVIFDVNKVIEMIHIENGFNYIPAPIWSIKESFPKELVSKIYDAFNSIDRMVDNVPLTLPQTAINFWVNKRLQEGHEVHTVSNRSLHIAEATKVKVKELIPNISSVNIIQGSKINTLKELKVDVMIDDSPIVINECILNGIGTIMISNNKTLYNHNLRSLTRWEEHLLNINIERCI